MNRIQKDKLLHFICGTYIYLIASVLLTPMLSILLVIIAGFAKGFIYLGYGYKGTFEWMDIVYTIAGGIMALIFSLRKTQSKKGMYEFSIGNGNKQPTLHL